MKLKICGMRRQEDLTWAAEAGFDCCGFIFHTESPRYIEPRLVRDLDSCGMTRIGVFVEQDAAEIEEIMAEARLDMAQLHGPQSREDALRIGPERVIRVLWANRYASLRELEAAAAAYADFCAWYLLESGFSGGGKGRRIAAARLAGLKLKLPWFLAGGLEPGCVTGMLAACQPDGLDFNSGLEDAPGVKNKIKIFAVKAALEKLGGKR